MSSRKPDYRLKVLNKRTDQRGRIGAGWTNEDGSISVVLDYCVVLPQDPDLVLTLFPVDESGAGQSA